jgi:hypothetical protein
MISERLTHWLTRHRALLLVTLLALAVRLYWNMRVHPPLDYAYSDMGGYVGRANTMLDAPFLPRADFTLFPYGTHVYIFLVKWVFGRNNGAAIGIAFALLGALAVAFTYATAERFSKRRWVHFLTGLGLIFYYPWISLGGYTLSEIPFTVGVAASTFYGLRLADEGRPRDAWLLGLAYGLGATARPQILVSGMLLVLLFVVRRTVFRNFTRGLWVRVAVPLALILAVSSVRLYWHTSNRWKGGAIGLVSTNGPLNFAFGRCHAAGIESYAKDGRGFFGPPSFGALRGYGKEHPDALFTLDPAMGETVKFQGHMWDAAPLYEVARKCVEKTGYVRQIKYAVTHVVLLWGYNFIWPDQGQKPQFRQPMMIWCGAHTIVLMPPAVIALLLAFRKRRARLMLLALHVWAVIVVAMLYFGDTRYRAPYDGIILILALESYATAFRWLAFRGSGWARSGAERGTSAVLLEELERNPQGQRNGQGDKEGYHPGEVEVESGQAAPCEPVRR